MAYSLLLQSHTSAEAQHSGRLCCWSGVPLPQTPLSDDSTF